MDGYVLIERGVSSKEGMCGIRAEPTYPVVAASPAPAPAPGPAPKPPAGKCCMAADKSCSGGQVCCSGSGKSYASKVRKGIEEYGLLSSSVVVLNSHSQINIYLALVRF